jgi:hypothetical protein
MLKPSTGAFLLALVCSLSTFVSAQEASAPVPAGKLSNDQLAEMALWPPVQIRDLLNGVESPAGAAAPTSSLPPNALPPPPVDLLFVLQARRARLEPNDDGGIVGGTLLLTDIQETIVSFADRPYRTFDAIPVTEFFEYQTVVDFFGGRNPPNAILSGELPSDVAAQANDAGASSTVPYRRLLGTVLGKVSFDPKKPREVRFDLPAGADVFAANGEVRILNETVFEEAKGFDITPEEGDDVVFPTLEHVSLFIDPLQIDRSHEMETHDEEETHEQRGWGGNRKLLQRRGGGFRGGRGGRAGAVRVGGGGFARASTGRRGFNRGVTNNFIRGGNTFVGGRGGRGLVGGAGFYPGVGGFGVGGLGYDPYGYGYDPLWNNRALAYAAPVPIQVNTPVPVPVPVPVPEAPAPPVKPTLDQVVSALRGTWRGDGGGAGMGAIVLNADDGVTLTASPRGCEGCTNPSCRWETATGPITIAEDGVVSVSAAFTACGGARDFNARGTLETATNGRNVLYWSPSTHSTQWIRN